MNFKNHQKTSKETLADTIFISMEKITTLQYHKKHNK